MFKAVKTSTVMRWFVHIYMGENDLDFEKLCVYTGQTDLVFFLDTRGEFARLACASCGGGRRSRMRSSPDCVCFFPNAYDRYIE